MLRPIYNALRQITIGGNSNQVAQPPAPMVRPHGSVPTPTPVHMVHQGMLANPVGYTAPQAATAQTGQLTNSNASLAGQLAPTQANINTQDQQMGTVQGRVASILDANSPLMQRARARANQASSARGLSNSSMAVGAAQNAVINTAMPIANADAASYNQISRDNQNANNSMLQFNAGNRQQVNLNNAAAQNRMTEFNASNRQQVNLNNSAAANNMASRNAAATQQADQFTAQQTNAMNSKQGTLDQQSNMFNVQQQNKVLFDQLSQKNKIDVMNIQAAYKNEMQANVTAQNLMQNYMAGIKGIQDSTTMSGPTKKINRAQFARLLKIGMKLSGGISNLNLSSYLNFGPL